MTDEERQQGWRPGGLQQVAAHAGLRRLYAIMHVGPIETHKSGGAEVWAYDLDSHRRIARYRLPRLATSIIATTDATPLLFAINVDAPGLDVYDARTGGFLRTVTEVGTTPTIMTLADGTGP